MQLGATFTMKPCREKAKSIYLHVRASSSRVTNSSTMDTLRALRWELNCPSVSDVLEERKR